MKRVLMIASAYPPQSGAGVQRTVKFVRYLPRFGWEPLVLTVRTPLYNRLPDPTMLREVEGVPAARTGVVTRDQIRGFWDIVGFLLTPMLRLAGKDRVYLREGMLWRTLNFLQPDPWITWLPTAIPEGLAMVRRYRPQVLYATAPSWTALLVGLGLSWLTRLPLVADFRDPWTTNNLLPSPVKWRRRVDARLERAVIARAARVVSVTPRMTETFVNDYRQVPRERFVTIFNGYDPEDIPPAPPVRPEPDRLCFAHVGSLYGTRSPAVFLQALQRVFASRPQMRQDLRVRFVGQIDSGKELLAAPEFAGVVESTGPVDHKVAAIYLVTSDILLLIQHPGALVTLPGKVFEYLAAPSHILACGPPDGEAAAFLRQTGGATIVDGADPAAIAEAIRHLYAAWKQGTLDGRRDPVVVRQFDRRELARQLAEVLDACARSPTGFG